MWASLGALFTLGSCSEPLPFSSAETRGEASSHPCREDRPLSHETPCPDLSL